MKNWLTALNYAFLLLVASGIVLAVASRLGMFAFIITLLSGILIGRAIGWFLDRS